MKAKQVVSDLGGAAKVARQLKSPKEGRRSLTTAAVCMWRRIPLAHVHEIVRMSGGKFSLEQLRPDVYRKVA